MAFSSNEDEVETSIGEGVGNPSTKKPETALAAAEKKQVLDSESDADSETERIDPASVVGSVTKTNDSVHDVEDCRASSTKVSGEEVKKSGGGEETKKTYWITVWSEEDEIALLQGLTDFETLTGFSFSADYIGAYQFVKKSISFDVSNVQFCQKLMTLHDQYNPLKRMNAEEPTLAKPHDRKVFNLYSVIWGPNRQYSPDDPNSKPTRKRGRPSQFVRWGPWG